MNLGLTKRPLLFKYLIHTVLILSFLIVKVSMLFKLLNRPEKQLVLHV
jgi:hypothetical protein